MDKVKRPSRRTGKFLVCKECKISFYVHKKRVNKALFCSMKCYHNYRRLNNPLRGYKHSKETIQKWKNKIFTKEHRKNLSIAAQGKIVTEKTKEKIRQNTIKQHLKGKFPQTNTIIEKIIEQKLKDNNIDFTHPFAFGRFVCDFAIVNKKIIIECDGDYWHNREDIKKKDKAKNAYFKKCGFKMLRFWEIDIKTNPNNCIKVIQEEICKN